MRGGETIMRQHGVEFEGDREEGITTEVVKVTEVLEGMPSL